MLHVIKPLDLGYEVIVEIQDAARLERYRLESILQHYRIKAPAVLYDVRTRWVSCLLFSAMWVIRATCASAVSSFRRLTRAALLTTSVVTRVIVCPESSQYQKCSVDTEGCC